MENYPLDSGPLMYLGWDLEGCSNVDLKPLMLKHLVPNPCAESPWQKNSPELTVLTSCRSRCRSRSFIQIWQLHPRISKSQIKHA